MAGTLLSPRFWPWRLGMAMGLPWLFRFLLDRLVRLPGGRLERAIESRVLMAIVDVLVLLESGLFGRTGLVRRLSEGIALGVGPVAVHAAALAAAGMYVFSLPGSATAGEAVLLALVLLLVGFEEEVRYRALAFRTLDQGVGSWLAMGLSGAFFGISHALGLPVSGTPLPGLLHVQMTGPEPWTGGGFGPEASTALQPFIFAAAAFYLWKVVVERKLTPPPWRARPVPAAPAVPAPASIPSTRGPAA